MKPIDRTTQKTPIPEDVAEPSASEQEKKQGARRRRPIRLVSMSSSLTPPTQKSPQDNVTQSALSQKNISYAPVKTNLSQKSLYKDSIADSANRIIEHKDKDLDSTSKNKPIEGISPSLSEDSLYSSKTHHIPLEPLFPEHSPYSSTLRLPKPELIKKYSR